MNKTATDFLREAADVLEERGKVRDKADGERSMARAVAAYRSLRGNEMSGELDGWLFMCVLKLARATAGSTCVDDWVDLSGYGALAAEFVSNSLQSEVSDNDLPQKDKVYCNGWTPHNPETDAQPVSDDTIVDVQLRKGTLLLGQLAGKLGSLWLGEGGINKYMNGIVAYRVVKE